MDPAAIAGLLKEYGPWGLSALLMGALVYVTKQWAGCFEKRVQEGDRVATVAEKSSATGATIVAALEARANAQDDFRREIAQDRAEDRQAAAQDRLVAAQERQGIMVRLAQIETKVELRDQRR